MRLSPFCLTYEDSLMTRQSVAFFLTLSFSALSFSAPQFLISHNQTLYQSTAYVDGKISLPNTIEPLSDTTTSWITLKRLCFGRSLSSRCPIIIKMGTDTGYPFDLGLIYIDLNSGAITPNQLSFNNVVLRVNNNGELTLSSKKP